jgi:protein-tyrosine phosphatase
MERDIVEIIPHLFISNWFTSNNKNIIKEYNINAVITVETYPKPHDILRYYNENNIDFAYINLEDSPNANIYKFFDSSYNFINSHIRNKKNVLVHCYAGISRSATLIINYLCRNLYTYNNLSNENPINILNYCVNFAKNKRSIINPNIGFLEQLKRKVIEYSR